MCRGCFNQLFLRDEFHSGGIAGLLGKAAGMPTRRAFMAYSVAAASALGAGRGRSRLRRGRRRRPHSFAAGRSVRWRARRSPRRSRSRAERCVAVGDESELSGLKTGDTKLVDLAGRTAAAWPDRPAQPHDPGFADLRTARRRRLRQISDPRKARRASQAGGGEHARRGNGSSAPISTIFCKAGISRGRNWTRFRPIIRSSSGTPTGTTPASTARR